MDDKKTISDLNKKTWYRLLKVVYVCVFTFALLGILTISVASIITSNLPSENGGYYSYAKCLDGGIVDLKQENIFSFNGYLSSDDRATIEEKCKSDITSTSSPAMSIRYNADGSATVLSTSPQYPGLQVGEVLSPADAQSLRGSVNYLLVVAPINWTIVITYSVVSILVILGLAFALFILLKRVFYYIVLGSFKPEK